MLLGTLAIAGCEAGLAAPSGDDACGASLTASPSLDAPAFIGEVLVRTDSLGRLAVIVDLAPDGQAPDGFADRVFILESLGGVGQAIDKRLPIASVQWWRTGLRVVAPEGGFVADLAVATEIDRQRSVTEERVVLHDGIALQARNISHRRVPAEAVDTAPFALLGPETEPDAAGRPRRCDSGGEGSTECSYSCKFSTPPVSKEDGCSVTCGAGYHACCRCDMLYHAECVCMRSIGIPHVPVPEIVQ
jgi:hypothetical protein